MQLLQAKEQEEKTEKEKKNSPKNTGTLIVILLCFDCINSLKDTQENNYSPYTLAMKLNSKSRLRILLLVSVAITMLSSLSLTNAVRLSK